MWVESKNDGTVLKPTPNKPAIVIDRVRAAAAYADAINFGRVSFGAVGVDHAP